MCDEKVLKETQDKLDIAIAALKDISIWSQSLQDMTNTYGAGIAMWRGCVGVANMALKKLGIKKDK